MYFQNWSFSPMKTCWQHAGNMLATWWQHDGNMMATWWQHVGNMLATCWRHEMNLAPHRQVLNSLVKPSKQNVPSPSSSPQQSANKRSCKLSALKKHPTKTRNLGNLILISIVLHCKFLVCKIQIQNKHLLILQILDCDWLQIFSWCFKQVQ